MSPITVTVYPIAGRQLWFSVPDRLCRECELTIRVVESVVSELCGAGIDVRLEIRPWLNNLVAALWRGGWHPPVVVVDGRVVSQGVVPDSASVKQAIMRALPASSRTGGD